MTSEIPAPWNLRTIRQAARVLGAQSSWVRDVQGIARAQRVVRDMLDRRGVPTETFHVPGTMPLVVAGTGPVLVVTFLDDTNPTAHMHDGAPPAVRDTIATSPGIIRKAGVLAAVGALTGNMTMGQAITLVVEADRHSGSIALERWLERTGRRFAAALCESVDLPITTPTVFPSAVGRVLISVTVSRARDDVEDVYGGVLPDLGHELALIISAMKSIDAEITVSSFYDSVITPTSTDIDALDGISHPMGDWIRSVGETTGDRMNDRHSAMAIFFAPSIVVRDIHTAEAQPFLPATATTTLEVRLSPGQHPPTIVRSIADRIRAISPLSQVGASTVRPPVVGKLLGRIDGIQGMHVFPVAPGNTPAGLLEERGSPTLGYAVVGRGIATAPESIDLVRVMNGTETILSLVAALDPATAHFIHEPVGGFQVVIVHHNGREHLEACLTALAVQSHPHQVIVVDNASTDGSLAPISWQFPSVRFIPLKRNVGFARGVNIAADTLASVSDTLITLNPDTVPSESFIEALIQPLEDPEVASVAGQLVFTANPGLIASAGIRLFRNGVAIDSGLGERVAHAVSREVFGASGGAAAFRMSAFQQAGGFCDAFFLYLEDVDLAWRLRLLGWTSMHAPGALATHAYSASSVEGSRLKRRHLSRNRIWTLARCLPSDIWRRDRWEITRFDAASVAWATTHRDAALLAGRSEAILRLPWRLCERRDIQRASVVRPTDIYRWIEPPLPARELLHLRSLTARLASGATPVT